MSDARDPYEVLGVRTGASAREIRTAYRALARKHHPDRASDPDSMARMIEINVAWEALRPIVRGSRGSSPAGTSSAPRDAGAVRPVDKRHIRRSPGGVEIVWRRGPDGEGAAGPPPGRPSGAILDFGRYIAWSLGEVARHDPGYLLWLEEREEARSILPELRDWLIDLGLRRAPVIARR